ncbi:MAG TPA: alpha/beta fold hydrolase [Pseudolabrys sp.]|nr:alpha/beta fold hydrolase [Pseudolabrys sp.]
MTESLHHEIVGSGPKVVLLHPVGLDLTFLRPAAAALSKEFTVLTVDQHGHGKSPTTAPAHSLEDYADDLHALLNDTAFAPAAIVGFSFGGMVAQTMALRYPADLTALVVCASRCTLTEQGRAISRARGDDARKSGIATVLEATLDRWFTPEFRAARKDAAARARLLSGDVEGWAQAWHAMADVDTLPHLPTVRIPTLCLAGEVDKSSPPDALREIAGAIPGARYAELPGAPHMLFIEQPQETAGIIGGFLREVLKARA